MNARWGAGGRSSVAAAALAGAVAAAAALAAARSRPALAAPPEPIRISFGMIASEGTPWAEQALALKQRIERESQGRLKMSLFLSGRRGSEREMLTELRRGKLQSAGLSNATIAAEVPELAVLEMPFLFRTPDEVDHVIDEVVGKELEAKIAEKGIFLSFWAENGWRSIGTRSKPVRTPEDVVGLRVRAQESEVNQKLWECLRAQATPIPLNEVLSALQTGVIEGFDQTPVYMSAAGWHTQVKYFTLTEHSYQPAAMVFNKKFIDSLPDDLRKIVIGDPRAETRTSRRAVRAMNEELVREFEAAKIEVIRLSEAEQARFRERAEPVYDALRDKVGAALLDKVKAALAEYRERAGKKTSEAPEKSLAR